MYYSVRAAIAAGRAVFAAGLNVSRRSFDTASHWAGVRDERPGQGVTAYDRSNARGKAREEFLNNPYGTGFPETFDLYVLGDTGPRLMFFGKPLDPEWNAKHVAFRDWMSWKWSKAAEQIELLDNLSMALQMMIVDGASFLMISRNSQHDRFPINYECIEPQRIANPGMRQNGKCELGHLIDGFIFDDENNLIALSVLDLPERETDDFDCNKYQIVDAKNIHILTRKMVPGQVIGHTWYAPILETLGRLRDTLDSVTENFKNSASIIGTMETEYGYGENYSPFTEIEPAYPYMSVEMRRNKWLQMPPRTKAQAFKPEQPVQGLWDIISGYVTMMGRGVGLTRNKSTGSSHEYNFSSSRLDDQQLTIRNGRLQKKVKEKSLFPMFVLFYGWIYPEAVARFGVDIPTPDEVFFDFQFPQPPAIDPEAQMRADAIAIKNCTELPQQIWRRKHGDDIEDYEDDFAYARKHFPWLYEGSPGQAAQGKGMIPPAENTRINEPKADTNLENHAATDVSGTREI